MPLDPQTQAEFLDLWRQILDGNYATSLEFDGDGQGFDAVVAHADVFVRITAPTLANEALGRVRSDVDGGDAIAFTGARFKTSGAAGELVRVAVNRP